MDRKLVNIRIVSGWWITGIWICLWVSVLYCGWGPASDMVLNEWGDFLAGVSAPLAFLWLVIGYFQQGDELGLNTKALKQQERALQLQVEELKQSVEQQNKSAIALSEQSGVSALMAKLEATNRILNSIDRQIERAERSNSANASREIKVLSGKQKNLESSLEKLLEDAQKLELQINGY
jgi:hypothetical protein